MLEFFMGLDNYSKVNLIIALLSTSIFVIKLLLTFIGSDADFGDDISFNTDDSFNLISVQSVLAFLMSFSWIGLATKNEWNLGILTSLFIAGFFGFAMMFAMAYLMTQVKKLNKIPKRDLYECIGDYAKAYTSIKPREIGQVQVVVNGTLETINAINETDNTIESFDQVIITDIQNNMLVIRDCKGELLNGSN